MKFDSLYIYIIYTSNQIYVYVRIYKYSDEKNDHLDHKLNWKTLVIMKLDFT